MTKAHVFNAVRIIVAVLVLAAASTALIRNWQEVSADLARVRPAVLVGVLALTTGAPIFTFFGWRTLLHDLGSSLPLPAGASVFFVGQLGKYLPGSVWTVVAQTDMGGRLGVPRSRMGVAGLLSIVLALATGAVIGLPALPLLFDRSGAAWSPWWLAPLAVLILLLLWPPTINAGVALLLRVLRRAPLSRGLRARALVATLGWFALAWVSVGLAVLILAKTAAPQAPWPSLLLLSLCGNALASALGMVSVIVPAGVGVRDGALVVLAASQMPWSAALALAVIARFGSVVVDLALALVGWLWARTHHLIGRTQQ